MLRQIHSVFGEWLGLKEAPGFSRPAKKSLRIADFFSGCGGMSLGAWEGARREGIRADIAFAVDFSPSAVSVFRSNFPDAAKNIVLENVAKLLSRALARKRFTLAENSLRKRVGRVDLLLAGPPCQGHSNLNNKTRRDDHRNDLYLLALRAIYVLKPQVALIENVPTVIHSKNGVIDRGTLFLKSLGYDVWHGAINCADHGVAQGRKRHFLIGAKIPLSVGFEEKIVKKFRPANLIDVIHDLRGLSAKEKDLFNSSAVLSARNLERVDFLFERDLYDLPDSERPDCHRLKAHSYRSVYGRMKWDVPAQTITTGFGSMGQGRFVHPSERRLITPHEAARIQGFPDFYSFDSLHQRNHLAEAIGNAVPPLVVADLLQSLIRNGHLGGK
jgi:DNA (cytosine-5)-methyltransferase 1